MNSAANGGNAAGVDGGAIQSATSTSSSTNGAVSTTGLATSTAQGAGGNGSGSSTGGSTGSTTGAAGSDGTGDDAGPTYVYVGSGSFTGEPGMITVYSLNRATKTLTLVGDHPAGGLAAFLAIDAERGRLFSADSINGGVQSFSIDRETGMLTSLGATANDNSPVFLSLTGDGQYLLAASLTEGAIDVYPIDESGKAAGSLGATAMGTEIRSVVIDDQNRVFAAAADLGQIAPYDFSSGTLTPGASSTEFDSPGQLFLASEKLYAVSQEADKLASFYVLDDALVLDWELPRLGSSTGDGADIQVTPSGKYLYATNLDPENSIVAYDISGSEPVYLGHQSTRGGSPLDLAIDPEEELVIVGNITSPTTLEIFSIQADGTLQHESTEATTFTPFSVGMVQF